MIQKKRQYSTALRLMDDMARATSPKAMEIRMKEFEEKGVGIHWERPKDRVLEELRDAFERNGVNRYVSDQFAKAAYAMKEPELKREEHPSIGFSRTKEGHIESEKAPLKRMINRETEERNKERAFRSLKTRLEKGVEGEIKNPLRQIDLTEENVMQLVKLTYSFKNASRNLNIHQTQRLALEMARDLKRKYLPERELKKTFANASYKRELKELDYIQLRTQLQNIIWEEINRHFVKPPANMAEMAEKIRHTSIFKNATKNLTQTQRLRLLDDLVNELYKWGGIKRRPNERL
jgi:hypothetical protein